MAKKPSKYTTVSIPIQLNEKLKELIQPTGFSSVSSFVTYVLRQIISQDRPNPEEKPKLNELFSKEDEEKVKARLRSLGYLK